MNIELFTAAAVATISKSMPSYEKKSLQTCVDRHVEKLFSLVHTLQCKFTSTSLHTSVCRVKAPSADALWPLLSYCGLFCHCVFPRLSKHFSTVLYCECRYSDRLSY